MNDDDAFKLNSLHRFQKHSKLVLEAHSHCEVPAGCGGAVLQWINLDRGVTVRVHVQSSLRVAEAFVDGMPVPGVGVRLKPGSHVLALAFVPHEQKTTDFWAMVHLEQRVPGVPTYPEQRVPRSQSRADGTWRATSTQPPSTWSQLGFDDAHWPPLARATFDGSTLEEWALRQFQNEVKKSTEALDLGASTVWLRKRFEFTGGST